MTFFRKTKKKDKEMKKTCVLKPLAFDIFFIPVNYRGK
jgi:hypothetical protein